MIVSSLLPLSSSRSHLGPRIAAGARRTSVPITDERRENLGRGLVAGGLGGGGRWGVGGLLSSMCFFGWTGCRRSKRD